MVIKIEFTPLLLSDCKMFPFKKGFKNNIFYMVKIFTNTKSVTGI